MTAQRRQLREHRLCSGPLLARRLDLAGEVVDTIARLQQPALHPAELAVELGHVLAETADLLT